jgi:transcription initiation factor TFIIIB Brf1 subunit/transcription initiation factor TFIIB
VCTGCGRVLDQIYLPYSNSSPHHEVWEDKKDKKDVKEKKIKQANALIRDICQNICTTENVISVAKDHFKKVIKSLPQNYAVDDIATYCVYVALEICGASNASDILSISSQTSLKKIFTIEKCIDGSSKNTQIETNSDICRSQRKNPTSRVNQYCCKLGLNFDAVKTIEEFVFYYHDKCAVNSNTLVASAIYMYCRKHTIRIPLHLICKISSVTPPSVHRFVRNFGSIYKSSSPSL